MAHSTSASLPKQPYLEALCIPPLLFTHKLLYDLIGALLSHGTTDYGPLLATSFDVHIPYIPIFIVPYVLTWAYGGIILGYSIYCGTYDHHTFRYFYLTFLALIGVECLIWYNFPASITIRVSPSVLSESGWLGELTAYVYKNATTYNVIPSAHIAFAFLTWLFSKHFALAHHRWMFLVLLLITSFSVVFIKNHYVIDIFGGVGLGYLVYRLVFIPASKFQILAGFTSQTILATIYLIFILTSVSYCWVLGGLWN